VRAEGRIPGCYFEPDAGRDGAKPAKCPVCDHVVVFDRGRPIAEGPPAVIRTDDRVLEAYLGV